MIINGTNAFSEHILNYDELSFASFHTIHFERLCSVNPLISELFSISRSLSRASFQEEQIEKVKEKDFQNLKIYNFLKSFFIALRFDIGDFS